MDIKGALRVLFTPSCWPTVGPYSKEWDNILNELLKTEKFRRRNEFTATLGPYVLWIQNMPYACFHIYQDGFKGPIPKRITMLRARDKFFADVLESCNFDSVIYEKLRELSSGGS